MFNLLPALILLILQAPGSAIVEPGQPAWKSLVGIQALADSDADSVDADAQVSTSSTAQLLRWCAFIALLGEEVAPDRDPVVGTESPKSGYEQPNWGPLDPGFLTPGRTRDGPMLA